MEILYRVENSNGNGPYNDPDLGDLRDEINYAHAQNNTHPSPQRQGYWMDRVTEKCAFRSMQDLFAWFGGWLPLLTREGYRVARVQGIVTWSDKYQVVYREVS